MQQQQQQNGRRIAPTFHNTTSRRFSSPLFLLLLSPLLVLVLAPFSTQAHSPFPTSSQPLSSSSPRCSHHMHEVLHSHGSLPTSVSPLPTSPPCGLSPHCDQPDVVATWIQAVKEMTQPTVMPARVIVLAMDDGSQPVATADQVKEEMDIINLTLDPYFFQWNYTLVTLPNSAARERLVLQYCDPSWIGDGECVGMKQLLCNSSVSNYAAGDCLAALPVCNQSQIGDGQCDANCNYAKYKYDGGDCCSGTAAETAKTCFEPFSPNRAWLTLEQLRALPFESMGGNPPLLPSPAGSVFNMYLALYPNDCLYCGASTTMPWDFVANDTASQGSVYAAQTFAVGPAWPWAGGSIPVHEQGHTFGLLHTFRGQEATMGLGQQCTNRTDFCMDIMQTPGTGSLATGDLIDDTPVAEFDMPTVCQAQPAGTDCAGQPWQEGTSTRNFMGFNYFACNTTQLSFTLTQTAKMHCNAQQYYSIWMQPHVQPSELIAEQ